MNWLDYSILALIAWFTLSAYLSGLIRETVGLASVILGVVLAGMFHGKIADSLEIFIEDRTATEIAGYLTIFVAVAVGGWVVSLLLRTTAGLLFLGWADHAAGALFGFLKGVVIVQAVIAIFVLQPALGMQDAIASSTIGSFFLETVPVIRTLLPSDFDTAIRNFGT